MVTLSLLLSPTTILAASIHTKPFKHVMNIDQNQQLTEDEVNTNPKESNTVITTTNKKMTNITYQEENVNPSQSDDVEAKSYLLRDYYSGEILKQKAANDPRPPASMTKMMTAFVVLDQIQEGKIKWSDEVTVSKRAADINQAQIFLQPGEKITVKELFTGLLVESANDAAVALAEYVGGTEDHFVKLMNTKVHTLGLKHTSFVNASGLDQKDYPDPPNGGAGGDIMSAYDSVDLVRDLLTVHPEILKFTSIAHYTFHKGTSREQKVDNWDKMLPGLRYEYKGVDGMKTGHTNAAGFCFTGTAKQNDFRLVSVVMGTASEAKRFTETAKLFDYGFQNYQPKEFVGREQAVPGHQILTVRNANNEQVPVVVAKMIWLPIHKGELKNYSYHVIWNKHVQAPLKKGTVVGQVEMLYKGEKIPGYQPIPLVTKGRVEKASKLEMFFREILS